MLLERVYRGPLKDTVIERFRDPIDGSVCYVYTPISVPNAQSSGGYAQYGANSIGNISCIKPAEIVQLYDTARPGAAPAPAPQAPAKRP